MPKKIFCGETELTENDGDESYKSKDITCSLRERERERDRNYSEIVS